MVKSLTIKAVPIKCLHLHKKQQAKSSCHKKEKNHNRDWGAKGREIFLKFQKYIYFFDKTLNIKYVKKNS